MNPTTGRTRESSEPPLFDLRLVVILMLAAGGVWLAIEAPVVAAAVGFGLTIAVVMHKLLRH